MSVEFAGQLGTLEYDESRFGGPGIQSKFTGSVARNPVHPSCAFGKRAKKDQERLRPMPTRSKSSPASIRCRRKRCRQYRAIAKLKSTYSDALAELIDASTGRIHTSFHQALTATGRLSSTDPNLQNTPHSQRRGQTDSSRIRRGIGLYSAVGGLFPNRVARFSSSVRRADAD